MKNAMNSWGGVILCVWASQEQKLMPERDIYILPGRGEKIEALGRMVEVLGYGFQGREVAGDFERLAFPAQLQAIRLDLEQGFWMPGAILIGHSYGAYLLLHTLAEMPPFPGRTFLLSPVMGAATARGHLYGSMPPRAKKLLELAEQTRFPAPAYLEIHTGANDNGCDPLLAEKFASSMKNSRLFIVEDAGHNLSRAYVFDAFRRFSRPSKSRMGKGDIP
jgi:pimeloyl-ACP methyl ester carboxylesterase